MSSPFLRIESQMSRVRYVHIVLHMILKTIRTIQPAAREAVTKKLLLASIGKGWISVIPPILRVIFTKKDIRRQRTGPSKSWKSIRVLCTSAGKCQYRRRQGWHWQEWE